MFFVPAVIIVDLFRYVCSITTLGN